MKKLKAVLAILVGLALVASIPTAILAQTSQPPGPAPDAGQTPQPKGGVATVIGVDKPDNCLRIRSGPGSEYDVIGCAAMGEQLNITGVWASNNWAQLADNGWVYGSQIQTDLRPPSTAYVQPPEYSVYEGTTTNYYEVYPDTYLPDYGYSTYWYSGIPVFLYNVKVWNRFHPWWRHRGKYYDHRVWNRNHNFDRNTRAGANVRSGINTRPGANLRPGTGGRPGLGVMPGTSPGSNIRRNFTTNRPSVSSPTGRRFDSSRFRSSTMNPSRTFRNFSVPNANRSSSFRSRSFGGGPSFRGSAGIGARPSFRGSGGFRGGSSFGGARIGGGGMRFGGGGARIGGGGMRFGGGGGGGRRR